MSVGGGIKLTKFIDNPKDMPLYQEPDEEGYIEHIYCEGSRRHVVGADDKGLFCSEEKCEINKHRNRKEVKPKYNLDHEIELIENILDYSSGKKDKQGKQILLKSSRYLHMNDLKNLEYLRDMLVELRNNQLQFGKIVRKLLDEGYSPEDLINKIKSISNSR